VKRIILVVDDEAPILGMFEDFFGIQFPDFEVVTRHTFQEGFEYALANFHQISVAYLDGSIGKGCGSDIARAMKKAGYQGLLFSISANKLEFDDLCLFQCQYRKPFGFEKVIRDLNEML